MIAGFVPADYLWDTVSIGTLMAFSVVAISIMVLRRTHPDLERPFKVPGYPVVPILTVLACVYIMSGLADHLGDLRVPGSSVVLAYYFLRTQPRHAEPLHHRRRDRRAQRSPPTGRRRMTYLVGYSPHKDDSCALALACQFARSESDTVHAPSPWCRAAGRRPAGSATDGEFEQWAAEEGEASAPRKRWLLAEYSRT